jgi:tetratricopeptide (TPR) repeat protein
MRRLILLFVAGVSFPWHNLSAEEAWRQDTKLLPPYCQERAKGWESAGYQKWRKTFGGLSVHIHHYCGGIYAEQKARSTIVKHDRDRWLRAVKGEMAYVARHCTAGCVLYPELHSRWGWALGASGEPAGAIEHFQLAIRAKPGYLPAYAKLSDVYIENNQPDDARRVLSQGLEAKPESRMLTRRLKKLDDTP